MVSKGIVISVQGLDEAVKKIKDVNSKLATDIDNGVKKAGFHVQSQVQESIAGRKAEPRSVDTGRFLNSVKTVFPQRFVAQVETNVEYADFLEYGTSRRAARPHFRNTSARETENVKKIINQEITSSVGYI